MSSESVKSIGLFANSAASASARGLRLPSRSPKSTRWSLSPWTTTPSLRRVALIWHVPPITLARPNRASSRSKCAMPFKSGTTAHGRADPIAGAIASIAESRSYALQVKSTAS